MGMLMVASSFLLPQVPLGEKKHIVMAINKAIAKLMRSDIVLV